MGRKQYLIHRQKFLRHPPAPAALATAPLTALSYEIKKGTTEEPFLGEKDAKHE